MSAGHLRRDRTAVLPKRARKIYAVCAHPLRALEPLFDLFPPPVQCGGCCALRATMIIRLRPYMAGPRPARSHCFRYFSRCLIFWCFWIKPKAQKKSEIDSYFLWESSVPSIRRLLRGAGLPPFDTKRWRQKCPQGTFVGIGRRFSLSGHKRLRCFARPLRALEPPSDLIPPPVQCGICGVLRATMIICWSPVLTGLRPAGSHCESSG